jgi:hypothetical protein
MAYNFGRGMGGALQGAGQGAALGPWGAAAGGVLGLLGGFGDDAGEEANKYLKRIPGTMSPYYQPYINQGNNAVNQWGNENTKLLGNYDAVHNQFNQLMNDPNAIISRIGAGYQKSPGFDWQMKQGQSAINNANASGGMLGTNEHQQQAGQLANNLTNQDYQQYLQQGLGLFNTGLQGNANLYGAGLQGTQGLANLGFNASNDLATNLAQALMSQSNLAFANANNQNQQNSGMLGNFFGGNGLSNLAGLFK